VRGRSLAGHVLDLPVSAGSLALEAAGGGGEADKQRDQEEDEEEAADSHTDADLPLLGLGAVPLEVAVVAGSHGLAVRVELAVGNTVAVGARVPLEPGVDHDQEPVGNAAVAGAPQCLLAVLGLDANPSEGHGAVRDAGMQDAAGFA